MTSEAKKELNSIKDQLKSESYISVLKKENAAKDETLSKMNFSHSKLNSKIAENQKDKMRLSPTQKAKDKEIEELKERMRQIEKKIKSPKDNIESKEINITFTQVNEPNINNELLSKENAELKEKVSELEKKVEIYEESLQKVKEKEKEKEFFITGNIEIILLTTENEKLKKEITQLKEEIIKINNEKNDLNKEIQKVLKEREKYTQFHQSYTSTIEKLQNEENNLKELLSKEELKSKNISLSLSLEKKEKFQLEEIIIKQEEKVTELSIKISKVLTLLKEKNEKLKENQVYIEQLEEMIKELNREFKNIRIKRISSYKTKMLYLKSQIEMLRKENEELKRTLEIKGMFKNNLSIRNLITGQLRRNESAIKLKSRGVLFDGFYSPINENNKINKKKVNSGSISQKFNVDKKKKVNWLSYKMKRNENNSSAGQLRINREDNKEVKEYNNIMNLKNSYPSLPQGRRFFNIHINNNYKPISLMNTDFLMEKQEKERIDEFKTILDKLVSDIDN